MLSWPVTLKPQGMMLRLIVACIVTLALFRTGASEVAAKGVLVLDVSSLWSKSRLPPIPYTQADCKARCRALPGCRSYTLCSSRKGCGSGCKAYVAANPPLKKEEDSPGGNPFHAKLPVLSFGPFTEDKNGCLDDRWPTGMCTLKAAGDAWPAGADSGDKASGWVTGQLPALEPACAGVSAAICEMCRGTASPATCLACVKHPKLAAQLKGVTMLGDEVPPNSSGNMQLDQCAMCANLDADNAKKCIQCISDDAPCSSCIPHAASNDHLTPAGMTACMQCVATHGKRFVPACVKCGAAPDPNKCNACLPSFFPRTLCRTQDYSNCYKLELDNPCANCQVVARAPAAQRTCLNCAADPARRQDCESCSAVQDQLEQQQCYACATKVPQPDSEQGGCGLCFSSLPAGKSRQQCITCVMLPRTPPKARRVCSLCAQEGLSSEQQARCFACVSSPGGSSHCEKCARVATTQAGFDACLSCYKGGINGPDCADCSMLSSEETRMGCFRCVVGSKLVLPEDAGMAALGSCAGCYSREAKDGGACLACNMDRNTTTEAKSWCNSCSAKGTVAQRSACMACLRVKREGNAYPKACGLREWEASGR